MIFEGVYFQKKSFFTSYQLKTSSPQLLRNIAKCFFGVIFILLSNPTFSQKQVKKISQQWIQSYHEAKLNSKWTLLLDGGYRWREGFAESSAYIIRGGIGYSILPNLRVATGLAHLGFYSNEKIIRQEFRPYQDLQYKSILGKISLNQRLRLEQRFFKDQLIPSWSDLDFNFRFRYQFILGIPVAKLSANFPDRKLILNLGNEIFLNAGKEVTTQVFDLNRLLISPTLQWSKALSISLTWNSQFASTPTPGKYIHSSVSWLQVRHNLDFKKTPHP